MQAFKNLILIGTSHIAAQSIEEVEEVISKEKPDVVALELDQARFYGLVNGIKGDVSLKDIRRIGFKGYVFAKVGQFAERKVGNMVGISPGDEMLKASKIAAKEGCRIALIDQRIDITLKRFSKEITWKEKFRFVSDIVKSIFSKKHRMKFDLTKVPEKELIKKILDYTKDRYPNFYKVLVEERNVFMAEKLFNLMQTQNKVVAVVGAGHEDGIIDELKRLNEKS